MHQIQRILTSAAASGGTVDLTEFYRASASDECAVTVAYRQKLSTNSALNMNFKALHDENNWNYEKLTERDSGVDKTTEKVAGGHLKLIQIYPEGKFCVEGITFSCGWRLNRRSTERSVVLDVPTIRNAWFRQGNPRFLEVNWDRNCLWFSDRDYTSVRAIDVHPQAFTDCENAAEHCIMQHIEVF